jgi:hypothetical protein
MTSLKETSLKETIGSDLICLYRLELHLSRGQSKPGLQIRLKLLFAIGREELPEVNKRESCMVRCGQYGKGNSALIKFLINLVFIGSVNASPAKKDLTF